jgi:hypothetical protein
MGFSISLQSFDHGECTTFDSSIAVEVFGNHIVWLAKDRPWLQYDGVLGGEFMISEKDGQARGVSLIRPSDAALRSLYELACLVPSAITWSENYVVANPAFIAGLPDFLTKAFGHPPIVANSGDELIQAIATS